MTQPSRRRSLQTILTRLGEMQGVLPGGLRQPARQLASITAHEAPAAKRCCLCTSIRYYRALVHSLLPTMHGAKPRSGKRMAHASQFYLLM